MKSRLFIAAAITVLAAITASCGDDDTTETTAGTTTSAAGVTTTVATTIPSAAAATIAVSNFQFTPDEVSIAAGETVTFAFAGTHTTTAVDDTWASGNKSAGETFDVTLDTAGTYEFFCSIHASMRGTITVTG